MFSAFSKLLGTTGSLFVAAVALALLFLPPSLLLRMLIRPMLPKPKLKPDPVACFCIQADGSHSEIATSESSSALRCRTPRTLPAWACYC